MDNPEYCTWCDSFYNIIRHSTCPNCDDEEPTEAQLQSYYDGPTPIEARERDERELQEIGRR